MEDKKITEMIFNREDKAITLLLEKYGRLFKNLSLNIVGNNEDAEECVNDACLETWDAIPPAKPDILLSFVCKIVRRVSINRLKYNLREKRSSDKTIPIEELSECLCTSDVTAEYLESKHLRTVINDYLRSIDEDSRNLFVKRYFFFESVKALSEHFGVSENNISVKLYRIRKELSDRLKEEGYHE